VGGDHSQAIGSVSGMKDFAPDGKVIWIDAHIDANTPSSSPSKNAHGMPLAFLSGIVPLHQNFKCMDMSKDICYFGIRSYEEEEEALLREKRTLVFEPSDCNVGSLEIMHKTIHKYFNHNADSKYWISFDIDGVDGSAFQSTGTAEGNGLSLEFTFKLFERFIPQTLGMDFTEVNFELTGGNARHDNEATFRELFEHICH
jgi:arginase